jgi:hypothetical protein
MKEILIQLTSAMNVKQKTTEWMLKFPCANVLQKSNSPV